MQETAAGQLQIIGAAYGLSVVTSKIIDLVNRVPRPQSLSVLAGNSVFGETWPGHKKSLTVIYRYDGGAPQVATTTEGSTLEIGEAQFKESSPHAMEGNTQPVLVVYGATFGPANVTAAVQNLIDPTNQTLAFTPNDKTFEDSWKKVRKSFVIAAAYTGQVPFVDIVVEGTPYALKYRPPLLILSAFWGLDDVLSTVRANVKQRSLSIAASNASFGDGWRKVKKTLEVVYQYSAQAPALAIAIEGGQLSVDYISSNETYNPPVDPRTLNVIKATFGPSDVTSAVAKLVSSQALNFTANDATLGDTWKKHEKAFSLTYSWGPAAVLKSIYREGSAVQISQPTIVSDQSFISLSACARVATKSRYERDRAGFGQSVQPTRFS